MLDISINELINISGGTVINGDLLKYGDRHIHNVTFDSRDTGSDRAFVPMKGNRVDSHRFIPQVLNGDTVVSFSECDDICCSGDKIIIKVENSLDAVERVAVFYRKSIDIPIVGITGSVGKTTTREMICTALGSSMSVYATNGNRNSQVGTPQVLFDFNDNADMAVMEMGVSMPGEMCKLADMVKPDAAVFTNIGITHIENLGSREGILKEKMHITDYMKTGSPVFVNGDNDLLRECILPDGLIKYTYGLDESCDAYAFDITINKGLPEFCANVRGNVVRVNLSVYGRHSIYNALAALLICDYYGLDIVKASEALQNYKGFLHRGQILTRNDITIIDDTYNAAPDSMKAAIDILCSIECRGRKIAVLADMKELGDNSANEHYSVGKYAGDKKDIDLLITYGELADDIGRGFGNGESVHTDKYEELESIVYSTLKPGDVILFKGSNSMKLFDLVDRVMEHDFA